jgi:hypothetical protein
VGLITDPRFVVLDTASISNAASKRHDVAVKELIEIFRAGNWIPFVTYHHLEEIACHQGDDIFEKRIDFFAQLPCIAYLRQPEQSPDVGSILDLRSYEIDFLDRHPGATHEDVVDAVRPKVRSGFCSGQDFVANNLKWWRFFRNRLADHVRRHKAKVANLTHFPMADPKEKFLSLPGRGRVRPREEARRKFEEMAGLLERRIRQDGDCRNIEPAVAATRLMQESFDTIRSPAATGDRFLDQLLENLGIRLDRLPRDPRNEDVGYEGIFVAQMEIHAEQLLRNKAELLETIRKEAIPSWVVWQEIDRRIRKLKRAEIGNLNDKHIPAFGLYVDVLNVDKRIAEILRQAAKAHTLLGQVYAAVPNERGFSGLLTRLRMGK